MAAKRYTRKLNYRNKFFLFNAQKVDKNNIHGGDYAILNCLSVQCVILSDYYWFWRHGKISYILAILAPLRFLFENLFSFVHRSKKKIKIISSYLIFVWNREKLHRPIKISNRFWIFLAKLISTICNYWNNVRHLYKHAILEWIHACWKSWISIELIKVVPFSPNTFIQSSALFCLAKTSQILYRN